jgi:hypothetical protein
VSVWSYAVQLNDPSGAGGSADATLVYDLQQALGAWSQYIVGAGNLIVALNIGSSTEGRASGGPTSTRFIGTNGGLNVYESVAENELALSGQFSGAFADISITVDPGYLQYLDLDSGLTSSSPIPGNELNPISVFLHELMHGFGMAGYYDQNGNLPGSYETNFDELISKTASGAYFVGAHAEAVYGGPVPITTNSPNGENYAHFGNQQSDFYATPSTVQDSLTLDLMNGIVFFAGYDYGISSLDLAVLQDLGYSIRTKPIVTAQNVNASRGQVFSASSLFSVSAATSDGITAYQFWDSTSDPNSGFWTVGGIAQPFGQAINVTAGQLASTFFQSVSGSDQLWVRVSDGVLWSDWESFNVNAPVDHTPTVTAPNYTASHNQNIVASSLFSVSDLDNDAIAAYQFWDSTSDPNSGYWVVGGVAQPSGQAISVTPSQLASATFQSASGTDQLWVRANDGLLWGAWKSFTVIGPPEHPPTVTAPGYNATHDLDIAATSLFSATDPESDTITAYQVWDSTADASSGYWIVGGVAQQAGRAINITPSQLSGASFQSGSGTDQLWVRASDGVLWSDWKSFNVTAPVDHAPVVIPVAADYAATHNQNIAATSLFSVSDADSDTIAAYQFWDSLPANGHWVVGGVAQPAGQAIDVTPAQLASATFQSGSGSSDHLWVRAFDGMEWGAWQDFYVTAALDHAPVVIATSFMPTHDQFAATSLFSVSDADNDTITAYQFWDSLPAGGHWIVGGAAQPAGQAIDVTPAQLGSATFQGGSGTTDHLWIRANDGSEWGAWQGFFVTTPADHAPVVTATDFSATLQSKYRGDQLVQRQRCRQRPDNSLSVRGPHRRRGERVVGRQWRPARGPHRRRGERVVGRQWRPAGGGQYTHRRDAGAARGRDVPDPLGDGSGEGARQRRRALERLDHLQHQRASRSCPGGRRGGLHGDQRSEHRGH